MRLATTYASCYGVGMETNPEYTDRILEMTKVTRSHALSIYTLTLAERHGVKVDDLLAVFPAYKTEAWHALFAEWQAESLAAMRASVAR